MDGFIAHEHWRGQYVTVSRRDNNDAAIAVATAHGGQGRVYHIKDGIQHLLES